MALRFNLVTLFFQLVGSFIPLYLYRISYINIFSKLYIFFVLFFRAAFKFGRRVHFALRRKMLKSPIARLPAISLYIINRPSGQTDCICEANVKRNSTRP